MALGCARQRGEEVRCGCVVAMGWHVSMALSCVKQRGGGGGFVALSPCHCGQGRVVSLKLQELRSAERKDYVWRMG